MNRREYWLNQVKLQEQSGESQAKYCARNGIRDSSFSTWRSRLKKELVVGKFVTVGTKEPGRGGYRESADKSTERN